MLSHMDEYTDDLQYEGLVILRGSEGFSYNQDSVLLANFVRAKPSERVLDMCSGGGIIAILAAKKTGAHFTAAEISPALTDMARRSAALNSQQDDIDFISADIRSLYELTGYETFDAAVCNPPYYPGGTLSPDSLKRIATHQGDCTVSDVALAASRMLKFGGRFYMCYPAAELCPAFCALSAQGVEPKKLAPVCARRGSLPYLFLIECKKGAKPGLTLLSPIVLEEEK